MSHHINKKKEIVHTTPSTVLFSTDCAYHLERNFIDGKNSSSKKGHMNYEISTFFCSLLNRCPIVLDFICKSSCENSHVIQKCNSNKLISTGTFLQTNTPFKYHEIEPKQILNNMIYNLYYEHTPLENTEISEEKAIELNLANVTELQNIKESTIKIGTILYCLFNQIGYTLGMFRLQFGHNCITKELTCCTPFTFDDFRIYDKNYKYVKYNEETYKKILNDLVYKK